MNIKIKETGKIETLNIINENGTNWTQDLLGNAGEFSNGQFVWSEEEDAYIASRDAYDWWAKYIADSNATDEEVGALASKLGIDESVIRERIAGAMDGINDYDSHRGAALSAMEEIKEEYATA